MVQINFAKREINCKLVYYGPGLSGKTTNLEVVHKKAPASKKGELTSIATEGDRTLFFDYMPLELGKVGGMNTKFQLYTVPGQVYYNATRKLVLQGADGVVFVADSQPDKMEENLESLQNLDDNLKEQGLDMRSIPLVLQWNKRDLPNVLPCEELDKKMNKFGAPTFEAVAVTGEGVFPTLRKLAQMVLEKLNKEYGLQTEKPAGEEGAAGGAKAKAPGATTSGTMPKPPAPPAAPKEGGAPKAPASAPPAAAKPASSPAMAKPPEPAKKPEPVATKEPPKKAEPPAPPAKKPEPVVAKAPAPAPEAAKAPDRSHKDQPNNWDRPITGMTKPVEPAKGGKGLLIAAILLVVLIGGGVGAYFFVPQFKEIVDQKTGLGGSK